jgi:RsiW-degrading membrane proteinase PrsW (M82 family)
MTWQLAASALIPPCLLLLALNWRGRPWISIALAVGLGVACAEVAGWVEMALTLRTWHITSFGALLAFTMVVAGMSEEICKYLAFRVGPGRTRWFREEYDGVLYAAAVSLGFAAWENLGYVQHGGLDAAYARAFTAIPIHAACGVIMGAYIGRARVRELHGWDSRGLAAQGLLYAVLLHGFYDMLAFSGSAIAGRGLYVLDAAAFAWAVRLALLARRRSPAFGGAATPVPPPATPTVRSNEALPLRDERVSAVLGLVPGLGQAYNGEYKKAICFTAILTLNVGLYAAIRAFVVDPGHALATLAGWGATLSLSEKDVVEMVNHGQTMLDIMLAVIGAWIVFSGLDAWLTARRTARLQGADVSYLVHVGLLLLLVLMPLMAGGGGGGNGDADRKGDDGHAGGGYQVTWVDDPSTINGWNPGTQGPGDGLGERTQERRDDPMGDRGKSDQTRPGSDAGGATQDPDSDGFGLPDVRHRQTRRGQTEKPQPKRQSGDPERTAEGIHKSYNDYLSSRLHESSRQTYFDHVPAEIWTIVHYRIAGDGTLLSVELVDTNGTREQAEMALDEVRSLAPLAPLPGNVHAIDVTELFWQSTQAEIPPGSLAEHLSRLPDGRRIRIEP